MITYTEKGYGLHEAIAATGHWLVQHDGVWTSDNDAVVQAIIDSYDPVPPARAEKNAELLAASEAVTYGNVTYMGTTFQADPESVAKLNGVITVCTAAGATPAGFYWVDAANNQVAMTLSQLQGLASAIMSQGWAAFQKLQTLKAQVAAATTVDAVAAVVWSWP